MLLTASTRKLLGCYVGMKSGRLIPYSSVRPMADGDFKQLLRQLDAECLVLHDWVQDMGPMHDRRYFGFIFYQYIFKSHTSTDIWFKLSTTCTY